MTDRESMTTRVLAQARSTTGHDLDGATADDTLASLGLDSLDVAEVCLGLEAALNVSLPDEALTTRNTVGRLAGCAAAAVAAGACRSTGG